MVEFAGWEMPVQYRGVIDEHLAVRGQAGLFDVSHMGEIEVRGAGALEFCQRLTANDVARLQVFQAQYSFLLNEQRRRGRRRDYLSRVKRRGYFICVNASNIDKDFAWLSRHAGAAVEVENVSAMYAQLALQGPRGGGDSPAADGARVGGAQVVSFHIRRCRGDALHGGAHRLHRRGRI